MSRIVKSRPGLALVLSQAATSASTLTLVVGWAAVSDISSVGRLSLALAVVTVNVALVRCFFLESHAIVGDTQSDVERDMIRSGLSGLLASSPAALLLIIAFAVTRDYTYLLLAISSPAIIVQDCWRYSALVRHRQAQMAASDLGFVSAQLGFTVIGVGVGEPLLLIIGYGCGALLGASYLAWRAPREGMFAPARPRAPYRIGWGLAAEFIAGKGIAELLIPIVLVAGGASTAGALRLLQLSVGPINVFETSLRLSATMAWKGGEQDIESAAAKFSRRLVLVTAPLGVLFVTVIWLAHRTGNLNAIPLTLAVAIWLERVLAAWPARYAFVLRLSKFTMRVGVLRWVSGSLILIAVAVGVVVGGADGLGLALVVAAAANLVLWRQAAAATLVKRDVSAP